MQMQMQMQITTLHYTTPHYPTLPYTALHYTTLQYTAPLPCPALAAILGPVRYLMGALPLRQLYLRRALRLVVARACSNIVARLPHLGYYSLLLEHGWLRLTLLACHPCPCSVSEPKPKSALPKAPKYGTRGWLGASASGRAQGCVFWHGSGLFTGVCFLT